MDLTNNPVEGTGYSVDEAATHIENLLDSDGTTEKVDAENEVDETSNTLEEEAEDETDTPETESEEVEDDTEGETDEEEKPIERDPSEILFEIDGQGITREEALKGYRRQSDYTKKMQELAEHRKKWMVQEVEFHQVRGQSEQVLNQLAAHVAQVFEMNDFGDEPDWETKMLTEDAYDVQLERIRFEKSKAAWQQKQSAREAAVKALYDSQAEIARQNEAFLRNKREHEIIESRETLSRTMPEVFGERKAADVNLLAISKFLGERGYSEAEILNVTDARTIALAWYAMKGMEASKKVKKAVEKIEAKPALTMPGPVTSRSNTTALENDIKRLKRTGSLDDAASALSKLF